jgi:hypothetical protein
MEHSKAQNECLYIYIYVKEIKKLLHLLQNVISVNNIFSISAIKLESGVQ